MSFDGAAQFARLVHCGVFDPTEIQAFTQNQQSPFDKGLSSSGYRAEQTRFVNYITEHTRGKRSWMEFPQLHRNPATIEEVWWNFSFRNRKKFITWTTGLSRKIGARDGLFVLHKLWWNKCLLFFCFAPGQNTWQSETKQDVEKICPGAREALLNSISTQINLLQWGGENTDEIPEAKKRKVYNEQKGRWFWQGKERIPGRVYLKILTFINILLDW